MYYFEDGFAKIDFKQNKHFYKSKGLFVRGEGGILRVKGKNRTHLEFLEKCPNKKRNKSTLVEKKRKANGFIPKCTVAFYVV